MPAAQQVVESGAPIVLQLGRFTFKLTSLMAQELLQSLIVQGYIMYGYMLDNKHKPEDWTEFLYKGCHRRRTTAIPTVWPVA